MVSCLVIVLTLKSVVVCYVLIIHISAEKSIGLQPNSEKKGELFVQKIMAYFFPVKPGWFKHNQHK